jgi:hypothetical protein
MLNSIALTTLKSREAKKSLFDDEQELENKQTVMDYREFVTRYKVCDVEDRVLYDGNTYDIIKVETMGRKRYMRLRCKLAR